MSKGVLFSSFRTAVSNKNKKEMWQSISMKMSASTSCPLRQWDVVQKKWHDFARAAKARGTAVWRDPKSISGGIILRAGVDTTPCSQSTPSLPPHTNTPSFPTSSSSASPALASSHLSARSLAGRPAPAIWEGLQKASFYLMRLQ